MFHDGSSPDDDKEVYATFNIMNDYVYLSIFVIRRYYGIMPLEWKYVLSFIRFF
jgi:hypothetical protein